MGGSISSSVLIPVPKRHADIKGLQQAPDLEEQSSTSLAEQALQKGCDHQRSPVSGIPWQFKNMTRDILPLFNCSSRSYYTASWNWRELTDNLEYLLFQGQVPRPRHTLMNI